MREATLEHGLGLGFNLQIDWTKDTTLLNGISDEREFDSGQHLKDLKKTRRRAEEIHNCSGPSVLADESRKTL